jgi:hypothetical protein
MSQTIVDSDFDFHLNQYLFNLLQSNPSSQTLRNQIQNDIQITKNLLSEQLLRLGCDEQQLNINYNNLIDLRNQIKSIETQINQFIGNDLINKINQLKSICQQNNNKIIRSKLLANIINKFEKIHYEIDCINDSFNNNLYEMSVQHIINASEILQELSLQIESNDDLKSIHKEINDFMNSLKIDITVKRQELIHNIKELFNEKVNTFRDDFNKENVFKFELIKCFKKVDYENFIKAFIKIGENEKILKELINSLNFNFVKPILNEEINELLFQNECQIIGRFSNEENQTNSSPLSLLKSFFNYLNQIIVNDNKIGSGQQLLRLLGQLWTNDLFDQILSIYLDRLMPKNESEVSSYLRLVDEAEDIRINLIEIGFIDDNNVSPFIEFASNINSHFSSRLCREFIISAKRIICQDLHQTVEVGNSLETDDKSNGFPSCRVSQFTIELNDLLQDIISLSNQCSTDCALALNETICNICELFIDISPVYHKKMITEFPQQNAIFHNNCMYFSFIIKGFASKYRSLNVLNEFVPILQQLGSEIFLKHMRSQEKVILGFLQSPHFCQCLNDIANEDSNSKSNDECVKQFRHVLKQCLVHLNFLKNAFTDVLPQKVYDKVMGTVVNTFLSEILHKILLLNDISSLGAVRLSQEIEFLLEEGTKFLGTKNPMAFVHKWSKFRELNFILKVSFFPFFSIFIY